MISKVTSASDVTLTAQIILDSFFCSKIIEMFADPLDEGHLGKPYLLAESILKQYMDFTDHEALVDMPAKLVEGSDIIYKVSGSRAATRDG
jgi:hypothetical protein